MNDLGIVLPFLPALVLHLVRATAFFAVVPVFGASAESKMLRLVLAIALAGIFWWLGPKLVVVDGGMLGLALVGAREALIGIAAGFTILLLTSSLVSAGEIISNDRGFSIAQVIDPLTGRSSPVVSSLFEVMGYLLLFSTNLHHQILRVLGASYELLPVGQPFDSGLLYERLAAMVAASIEYGLRYAVPVLGVMTLLTAALVILSRAVPNLNLMEFSWGLRILLALLASAYFLYEGRAFLFGMFDDMLERSRSLFAVA